MPALSIACGAYHSLVIAQGREEAGRQLLAFGWNNFGQLGFSTTTAAAAPPPQPDGGLPGGQGGLSNSNAWVDVASHHVASPQLVHLPGDAQPTMGCGGGWHTICATACGRVFAFGCNDEGQLSGTSRGGPGAVEVTLASDDARASHAVCHTAAGFAHSAAIRSGQLFLWGRTPGGVLGSISSGSKACTRIPVSVAVPGDDEHGSGGRDAGEGSTRDSAILLRGSNDSKRWVDVVCGRDHALAVAEVPCSSHGAGAARVDARVYVWGAPGFVAGEEVRGAAAGRRAALAKRAKYGDRNQCPRRVHVCDGCRLVAVCAGVHVRVCARARSRQDRGACGGGRRG
jgi:alpha-tubulin suppressor-like RCC1 family protein